MQQRIILPDRKTDAKTWFSEIATDVMPAIKPIEIPAISKAWSQTTTHPAATMPRDKPSWTQRITHASTMRAIWILFEISLFCVILVKILLMVAAYH